MADYRKLLIMHQRNFHRIHNSIHLDDAMRKAGHRVHFYRTLSETISSSSLYAVRHKNIYRFTSGYKNRLVSIPLHHHVGHIDERKKKMRERGIKKLKRYPNNVRNIR